MNEKTISLDEWNKATTEQRSQWLKDGYLIRPQDGPSLQELAFGRLATYARNVSLRRRHEIN